MRFCCHEPELPVVLWMAKNHYERTVLFAHCDGEILDRAFASLEDGALKMGPCIVTGVPDERSKRAVPAPGRRQTLQSSSSTAVCAAGCQPGGGTDRFPRVLPFRLLASKVVFPAPTVAA